MKLKLFECRVLWKDAKGISRFTLLHTDKASAKTAIYTRLDQLGTSHSDISKMVLTEMKGPFEAGDFIHQEFQYMSPSEFKSQLQDYL